MYFLRYAFLENRWVWFHILAGAFLARCFLTLVQTDQVVGYVFLAAVTWELLEVALTNVEARYGSLKRFFLDAVGDVMGAVIAAVIVVF